MTGVGVFAVVALLLPLVHADIYLHTPAGSNNRLNERKRNRNNANRLFDSQNNNRGGYNNGGNMDDDLPLQFVAGSELPIEWTNQHECGQENTRCDIILQYMCDPNLRDGTRTGTISDRDINDRQQNKGRHESPEYYMNCRARKRNMGLFVADQELNGNSAIYTRQNPKGTRRGLECPEERDYYPYWGPSPWKDIAVLTDNTTRCEFIKQESQNVKAKSYCRFLTVKGLKSARDDADKRAPITKAECDNMPSNEYAWVDAPAHGIPAPDCSQAPKSRDNHNGNSVSVGKDGTSERIPQTLRYLWKVPNIVSPACALRIRYNISVLDYEPETTFSGANIDIKGQYDITGNNDRGYKFKNNPKIQPLAHDGDVEVDFELELAINTAQTGRTFQDRTHKFQIVQRDPKIPNNAKIHNLITRGRRGNIVQLYPAVEYDFVPNVLKAKQGDYIHPQWTGALTLPGNDDGEGRAGTDKNNMILLRKKPFGGSEETNKFANGYPTTSYPQQINNNTMMGVSEVIARRLAVPLEGDAPDIYFQNPCPRKKKDEAFDDIESELGTLSSLLDETLSELNDLEKYDRTRRSTTDVELAEEEIGDAGEVVDEDVVEDSHDPQRSRRSRRRRRRRRRTSTRSTTRSTTRSATRSTWGSIAGSKPISSPLVPLTRTYACDLNQRRLRRGNGGTARRRRTEVNSLLNDAPAYVDIGPLKTEHAGKWIYMCTRNNNFSNRSQKGTIIVSQ